MPFTQASVSVPKKRGRPRKNPLPNPASAVTSSPVNASTPARKRGRPSKNADITKEKSPDPKQPSSTNKRLMASVRRSTREKDNLTKSLFPPIPPALPTQSPNHMFDFSLGPIGALPRLASTFTPVNHTSNGFGQPLAHPTAHSAFMTPCNEDGDFDGHTAATTQSCSCNSVKTIMRDIFFRNAVQDRGFWIVPKAAALEMHHYFGGGAPEPKADLLIPADKVEMIRNLLF
jgi:hypothetical protein